jgi:hypothetical protein
VITDARVRVAAALCGIAAVGGAAAGFLDGAPALVRALAALVGAWVCPALLLVSFARAHRGFSRSVLVAGALFLTLSIYAILSESFRLAGAPFSLYANATTWALLLVFLAVVVAWQAGGRARSRPALWRPHALWFLAGVAVLLAIAVASRHPYAVGEDAFDHIGYVRRVLTFDSMRPDHVLAWPVDAAGTLPPDPRKGALHPAIAWIAWVARADVALVWSLLPLVLYPGFVLAFVAFSQAVLVTRNAVVACVALFLLSHSGTAFQLSHAAAYGQNLAAAWYWVLAAIVLGARGQWVPRDILLLATLALGGALTHAGVALHASILAVSVAVFAPWLGARYRPALVCALVLVAAAVGGMVLRAGVHGHATNWIHGHVQGVLFVSGDFDTGSFVVSPMEILRQHGMVFLGGLVLLPLALFPARKRADARAVLALGLLPMCIAFIPPLATALYSKATYMVARSLLNVPALAASVVVIGWMVSEARRRGFVVRTLAVVVVATWVIAFVRPSLRATVADAARAAAPAQLPRTLAVYVAGLPGGSVVLSDAATSYAMSAYSSHRFVALFEQHANPYDDYALDRLQAVRDAISPFASAQQCVEACRRFGVDFVIVSAQPLTGREFLSVWDPALYSPTIERLRAIPSLQEVHTTERFVVFRVQRAESMPALPDRMQPPVVVESPVLPPCVVNTPEHVFEITGVGVTPSTVAAGDSITIALGLRRDGTTRFGIPLVTHIRFDHESVRNRDAYPGEKHVRRFQERRQGGVARFRADLIPGAGVYDPDLWPLGTALCERVGAVIPPGALPGRYRVEVNVVRASLLPNFHLRDVLFNRDHYSGTTCTSLVVE